MNKINYLLLAMLSIFSLTSCSDDSASNPSFGDEDVPRIYINWVQEMVFKTGDSLNLSPEVSPDDGATYKWTLGDKIISDEKYLRYEIEEFGEFTLKFEVDRNDVKNSRISKVVIAKQFVEKPYSKISAAYLSINGSLSDVSWDNITHLILTSSVIQANGLPTLSFPNSTINIPALITAAHNNGVYVIMEFSGSLSSYINGAPIYGSYNFYNTATSASVRSELIKNMLDFTLASGFDGINVYMEKAPGPAFTDPQALKEFYVELGATVPETTDRGKFFLTMSVVTGWTKGAFDGVVTAEGYDWVNVLPYAAESLTPGAHSLLWTFTDDAAYWVGKGVTKNKIVLAAPAFGLRYFGNTADYTWGNLSQYTEYRGYRAITNEYPNAHTTNKVAIDNGIYYDGINEVKAKAEHVVSQGYAGMSLWTIENDSKDAGKSLMKQINTSLGN